MKAIVTDCEHSTPSLSLSLSLSLSAEQPAASLVSKEKELLMEVLVITNIADVDVIGRLLGQSH